MVEHNISAIGNRTMDDPDNYIRPRYEVDKLTRMPITLVPAFYRVDDLIFNLSEVKHAVALEPERTKIWFKDGTTDELYGKDHFENICRKLGL